MKNGMVFDIQRFSLHDGPGIRTTIFLKGCPLQCIWCHNPESWNMKPQLLYKKEKCMNCFECVSECRFDAHGSENHNHSFIRNKCKSSFQCVKKCAYDALVISGYEIDCLAVLNEAHADYKYFINSGGGITISGGEPMLQFEFTLELLKSAKERNIHTCIETCGFADQEKYREVLKYTDLFLFDIKATDSEKHKELTGVSNEIILKNLDFLYEEGADIILRCPLIPEINDSQQHLEGIMKLESKYPSLRGIEILPYHDMGRAKWQEVGYDFLLEDLKSADNDIKEKWTKQFEMLKCKKVVLL